MGSSKITDHKVSYESKQCEVLTSKQLANINISGNTYVVLNWLAIQCG
jgi:hypothetical protein